MVDSREKTEFERAKTSASGFAELFDTHYDRVFQYAFRRVHDCQTAEDIAALTFEQAWRGIKRVEWQGKPAIAWLIRIASRRVADHYRRGGSRSEEIWDEGTTAESSKDIEGWEDRQEVRTALEHIDQRHQEIIRLVYFDELENAEIAVVLQCKPSNVYVRLHRALRALRQELKRSDSE